MNEMVSITKEEYAELLRAQGEVRALNMCLNQICDILRLSNEHGILIEKSKGVTPHC